jgi:hypothetical protein
MIDTSKWKEYRMSGPEREYLDAYLANLKKNTDPDLGDDVFFARFCIAQILKPRDLDVNQLADGYTDGRLDGGADAIYFFVAGKLVTEDMTPSEVVEYEGLTMSLHLIQATRSPHFPTDQLRKLEDFSKDLLDSRNDIDEKAQLYNADVRAAIRRFHIWWQDLKMKLPSLSIHFHIASKGDGVHPDVATRAEGLKRTVKGLYHCDCDVHFYNAKMLLEMAKQSRREPVEMKFIKQLASDHWGNAFVCLVTIKDYITLITTKTGDLRDYVLEPNVRAYLGSKGVNSEIRNTLLAGSKTDEFWWLNNGVTITSSQIKPGISSLVLKDARVVNGLQTSREIYHYFQQKPKAAMSDERHVLVKVIEADKKSARNITKTTNNQTKIDPIYLRTTTDDIHDAIEAALPTFGFYYERVKNQYYDDDNVPRSQIVTLDYLTRALVAIIMQKPEQARGSPGQFVQRHYKQIFSHTCKPEVFGHTIQLMKKVDDFVVARVEAKTDRANLKYYLALDAICSVAKRSTIQRGTIAKLKADKLTQEVLEGSLSRVQRIYEHIRARGVVPDLVAKGGEFVFELKRQLDERFPPKHKKTENLLWSAMEQEQ